MSCAAVVGVLSLFFRQHPPDDVVVVAECGMNGALYAPSSECRVGRGKFPPGRPWPMPKSPVIAALRLAAALMSVLSCRAGGYAIRDDTVIMLAKANGARRVLLPTAAAAVLRRLQQKRPVRLGGVELVEVSMMKDVVLALWGSTSGGQHPSQREGAGQGGEEEQEAAEEGVLREGICRARDVRKHQTGNLEAALVNASRLYYTA